MHTSNKSDPIEAARAALKDADAAGMALVKENQRLRAALAEIMDLELEGDASLGDAMAIADEALHPSPVSQT